YLELESRLDILRCLNTYNFGIEIVELRIPIKN
ncbi:unnamed protein product, partial [Allacma fusca]